MSEAGADVLAFSPHPDDVEICCGGLLAAMAERGHRVEVVDLTRGELASNGTPEERAEEARAAAEALGLADRANLALPDGGIDPGSGQGDAPGEAAPSGQLARVVETIRRRRPALVLAPHAPARHPDHEATSTLVTRAAFFASVRRYEPAESARPAGEPAAPRFAPDRVVYYQMRGSFEPSFVVDVTGVYELKRRAIACYASQVGREGGAVATLANAPRSLAALEARDRHYGASIGVDYGEPFLLRAPVPMDDPVAALRGRPPALWYLSGR